MYDVYIHIIMYIYIFRFIRFIAGANGAGRIPIFFPFNIFGSRAFASAQNIVGNTTKLETERKEKHRTTTTNTWLLSTSKHQIQQIRSIVWTLFASQEIAVANSPSHWLCVRVVGTWKKNPNFINVIALDVCVCVWKGSETEATIIASPNQIKIQSSVGNRWTQQQRFRWMDIWLLLLACCLEHQFLWHIFFVCAFHVLLISLHS